jgi:hypothetical protein
MLRRNGLKTLSGKLPLEEKTWINKPVTDPKCALCVLEDAFSGGETTRLDKSGKYELIRQIMIMLGNEFTLEEMPSVYITRAHRILKKASGLSDPFRKAREICNKVGQQLALNISQRAKSVEGDFNRFKFLTQWSIVANTMDIRTAGTGYKLTSQALSRRLKKIFDEGLAVDETEQIYRLVSLSKRVLFVLDNVGEIAVDRLLIEEFQKLGPTVVAAVRGGPLTSDATKDDAIAVGFDPSKIQLITTGPDTLGITFNEMSEEFRKEAAQADLIVGKGQANFYAFCQYRNFFQGNVVSLFRTKCNIINRLFGKNVNINVAVIVKAK